MSEDFDSAEYMYPTMQHHGWKRFCKHPSVIVDEGQRTIQCQLCGAMIDPFAYLNDLAKQQDRFRMNIKDLNALIASKTEVLEDLKRQERNARDRLHRLTAKNLQAIGGGNAAE